jgi:cobalt/nickel transport protein
MLNKTLLWGLILSLIMIVLLTPLSMLILSRTECREGLEVIAEELNLTSTTLYRAPLHDYITPGVENEYLTTVIAGIIGVLIVIILTSVVLKLLTVRRSEGL